jgi:SPP1 family phage portal protein
LEGGAAGMKVQADAMRNFITTASTEVKQEENPLGHIPIIEYRYNSTNMAAPEPAISLLDQINNIQSNRCDGIEQFIQSIAVAVNCQFDQNTTADDIRRAGMILLRSVGENKADFKILSEQLDQSQTQMLVDDLYDKVLTICAMPAQSRAGRGTYDSTGQAAIFNNGWEQAAACARNTEDLFKESNRLFDRIFVDILKRKGLLDISLVDFELNFVRNETAGVQSKAQALQTMLAAGMAPVLAFAKSGISNDPVSDVKQSEPYLKMVWGDTRRADQVEEQTNGQGEARINESDNNNGENVSGGSA